MSSTVRSYGLIAMLINPLPEEPMSFLVRTDAGSEMVCTVNEIHEIWTIGPYFIKPVQAL